MVEPNAPNETDGPEGVDADGRTDLNADRIGPAHEAGTARAEDKP